MGLKDELIGRSVLHQLQIKLCRIPDYYIYLCYILRELYNNPKNYLELCRIYQSKWNICYCKSNKDIPDDFQNCFLEQAKYSEFWSSMKWIVHFHPLIISRYPAEESGHGNMSKYNINIEWLSYCRKAFYGFPNKNERIVKIIYDIVNIHILRLIICYREYFSQNESGIHTITLASILSAINIYISLMHTLVVNYIHGCTYIYEFDCWKLTQVDIRLWYKHVVFSQINT